MPILLKIPALTSMSTQVFSTRCCNNYVIVRIWLHWSLWVSPQCQTAPEPDLPSTADTTCGHSQLACTISWHWSSGFLAVWSTIVFSLFRLDQRPKCIAARHREFWRSTHFLREEQLKVALTCMGTTQSICCRDYIKISHISKGIAFWTYVDWEFFFVI